MHVCVGGSLFFHGCSSEQIVLYNHNFNNNSYQFVVFIYRVCILN